jgi:integrase
MLAIHRRHIKRCSAGRPEHDRQFKKCSWPVWVEGMIGGEWVRESLRTRNWQKASQRVMEAEARGSWTEPPAPETPASNPPPDESISVAQARDRFLKDAEHGRRISESTLRKYKLMLRQLEDFAERKGIRSVDEFDVEALRLFREEWNIAARTAQKKLERVRSFFRFCLEGGWIDKNPAKLVRGPANLKEVPKLPFEPEQMDAILEKAATVDLHGKDEWTVTNDDLVTFILVLRYSGLRIGDASLLTNDRIDGDKLYLYTQKSGQHVYVPLPPYLVERLKQIRLRHGRYYFTGPRSLRMDSAADLWRRKLARTFKAAKIPNGHPHRFRHTFAVELLKEGVPIESVSILLGHSSVRITEKHYAAWVKSRQQLLESQVSKTWKKFVVLKGGRKKA